MIGVSVSAHSLVLARLLRATADAITLAAAFFFGTLLAEWIRGDVLDRPSSSLPQYLNDLIPSLVILITIGITTFSAMGFYTRRRFYRTRYKALAVVQGVGVTFLLFGFAAYALRAAILFPSAIAIVLSGVVCAVLMLCTRVLSHYMVSVIAQETDDEVSWQANHFGQARVLVIGGAGYIGSALLPRLLASGCQVRILDSLIFGEDPIAQFLNDERVELVNGDFRRIDQLVACMQEVDAVVHLGGLVGDPACALDEGLTIETNLSATRAIAELAKAHGIRRFLFASTCSVYGASDEWLDERSTLSPVSLYAKSKVASERVLNELADERFRPTILRFGTVYGLSGRTRFDLVVNLMTAQAATEKVIRVFGADQWRPFVHVNDVAEALVLALGAPDPVVAGRVFNVGSNAQNATLGALASAVSEQVSDSVVMELPNDGDRRNYRVCFDRIALELGFQPAWTLSSGIAQVLGAVRSGAILNYSSDQYSNEKMLRCLIDKEAMNTLQSDYLRLLESNLGFVEEVGDDSSTRMVEAVDDQQ